MRDVLNQDQFTPFGLWIRQYLPGSSEMSVTNLDYVLEHYAERKIMLVEEKQDGGQLHKAQRLTFAVIDECLRLAARDAGYEYWGFYLLQLPRGKTFIGPGVTLNGRPITVEALQAHLSFKRQFCPGLVLARPRSLYAGEPS